MKPDCYFCHIKTIENLVHKFKPENGLAEDLICSVHELLHEKMNVGNPELATDIHRVAKLKLKSNDLYSQEKFDSNSTILNNYSHWRNYIDHSNNPFHTAIKLAVIGNIIDYAAHSLNGDLITQVNSLLTKPLKVDKSKELQSAIDKAKSVLYLGDNAGEIVFDKLFLETINHPNVIFATRGYPIINDVTLEDAKQVGINNVCSTISNGYDAPSTLLEFCSDEFKEVYRTADLIISKGQGNFEGLMNKSHPNTFFLLIAKCNPIAKLIGCNKNDMIVTKLNAL